MRHFFIHGRTPELSIAEILAVLSSEHISYSDGHFLPSASFFNADSDLTGLMSRLGGVLKYGHLLPETCEFSSKSAQIISSLVQQHVTGDGRITFGFSIYNTSIDSKKSQSRSGSSFKLAVTLRDLGLAVKKELKSQGYSVRYVAPQSNTTSLSSVVVTKNKLTDESGVELVFFIDGGQCQIGVTRAVQPFEEYSERDWSRPHRGMNVGLLPPKLAQIMINLSGKTPADTPAILDPFCGFGTVLQEALLMGFTRVMGSDKSPRMVEAARDNIAWLVEQKLSGLQYSEARSITHVDATRLAGSYKKSSVDAVVTEPYLGPIVHAGSDEKKIREIQRELSTLYKDFLRETSVILTDTGVAVMVWPVWLLGSRRLFLPILDDVLRMGFVNATLPSGLKGMWGNITERGTILYARAGQNVGREVMVLRKK